MVIDSAYAGQRLAVAARVAGADSLVDKNSRRSTWFRRSAASTAAAACSSPSKPGDVQDAMRLLDRPEAQILAMLLADVPPSEIAVALSMPPATVGRRVNDISAACARTRP